MRENKRFSSVFFSPMTGLGLIIIQNLLFSCNAKKDALSTDEAIYPSLFNKKKLNPLDDEIKIQILDIVKQLEAPITVSLGVGGFFLMFFGFRYLRISISIIALVGGNLISWMIITTFWNLKDQSLYRLYGVIIGCFSTGLVFSLIVYCCSTIGFIQKGQITGLTFGLQVYGICIGVYGSPLKHLAMFAIISSFAVLGTCLGMLIKKNFFIITTSYLGSHLFMRAVGTVLGNYPNIFLTKEKLPHEFYLYIGLEFGLSIFALIIQLIMSEYYTYEDTYGESYTTNQVIPMKPKKNKKESEKENNVNIDDFSVNNKTSVCLTGAFDQTRMESEKNREICKDEENMEKNIRELKEYTIGKSSNKKGKRNNNTMLGRLRRSKK